MKQTDKTPFFEKEMGFLILRGDKRTDDLFYFSQNSVGKGRLASCLTPAFPPLNQMTKRLVITIRRQAG